MSGGSDIGGLNDVGGIFAGAVALLAAAGAGLKWLLNWTGRREESRAAKLQKWHDELDAREKRLDAEREAEINVVKAEMSRLRGEHKSLFQCYYLLASALVRLDPTNPALTQAARILATAFTIDPITPDDMADLLAKAH